MQFDSKIEEHGSLEKSESGELPSIATNEERGDVIAMAIPGS